MERERGTAEVKFQGHFISLEQESSIFFNSDMKFTCRTISLTETVKRRSLTEVRTWVSCVVLGLEEQ